ncbi:MAG: Na/Pi cotransporter family protein [Erythrobacter sp.]
MSLALINNLVGGLGLFLLGMWLMTDGLKLAAGEALQAILERWTRTPARAFSSGFLITALVQSSSATTVAIIGFVNAGLMTLAQAIWVIVGANAGTTMTSWLIALVGIKVEVGAFAMLLLGGGMFGRIVAGERARLAGLAQAISGFGAFFLGIAALQAAFADLTPYLEALPVGDEGLVALLGFIFLGFMMTVLTQSSSAAMAIALTASATGGIPLALAAAVVIGTNLGTTSTAILAVISATPAARRVAAGHVVFNLVAAVLALVMLPVLLWISQRAAALIDTDAGMATVLAVFHTLLNLIGALAMVVIYRRLVRWLEGRFVSPYEDLGRPHHLDDTLLQVPTIALRGLAMELGRLMPQGFAEVRRVVAASDGAAPANRAITSGYLRLSQRVRQFIARLGATRLPADLTDALPAMIRATQHLDEALVASETLAGLPPYYAQPRHAAADALQKAASECLDLGELTDLQIDHPELLEERARRLELAYEEEKDRLLAAAASGAIAVETMETLLERAQLWRRTGALALKAQRRLGSIKVIGDVADAREAAAPDQEREIAAIGT